MPNARNIKQVGKLNHPLPACAVHSANCCTTATEPSVYGRSGPYLWVDTKGGNRLFAAPANKNERPAGTTVVVQFTPPFVLKNLMTEISDLSPSPTYSWIASR